jgi:hypothetical protein
MSHNKEQPSFALTIGLSLAGSMLMISACKMTISVKTPEQALQAMPSRSAIGTEVAVLSSTPTTTVTPSPPATDMHTYTSTPTSTPTPTQTASIYCKAPVEDYTRVEVNGEMLNRRTEVMLDWAVEIYGGPGDLKRVAQGSYTNELDASFGTHAGGGAVDISIRNPANPSERLFDEVEAMIFALRHAGFAAWYREAGAVYPDSAPHIHAIAIGDRELSPAAEAQLTGPYGYFSGLDGLPPEYGGPNPDPHGTPVICPWMNNLGYYDLRDIETAQP